ncbi:MAG: carbon monoxide dehydrogenase, partial [Proteobacteria bacterium]|nr:carbon monoxide dehydrogenase [Pseudomonadota bacterium]
RRVRFNLSDRLVLIPVELVQFLLPMVIAAVLLYFIGGLLASAGAVTAMMVGVVLFPVLLPRLPTSDFSVK